MVRDIDWVAFEEGRYAFQETNGGFGRWVKNPYPYGSLKNESWRRGWNLAQEREKVKE